MKKEKNGINYETDPNKIKKKRKRRKIRRIAIAGGIFVLLVLLVMSRAGKKSKKKDALGDIPVQIIKTRSGDVNLILKNNGEIKAKYGASIFSDVAGRVRKIYKREGMFVRKGEPLFSVDRRSMGVDYLDFIVRSPITGVVGSVDVEVGYTIGPQTQLMKVVNTRFMECIVDVVEKDIDLVKEGLPAKVYVDAYPDVEFKGVVSSISSIVHPLSRTVQIKILIDNRKYPSTPLKDGMYANSRIFVKTRTNVPLVPYSAVLDNQGQKYLFVVKPAQKKNKDSTKAFVAEKRLVKMGILKRVKKKDGGFIDFVEIKKGVDFGEPVVFMGHRFLEDGTSVELRTDVGDKILKSISKADALNEVPMDLKKQQKPSMEKRSKGMPVPKKGKTVKLKNLKKPKKNPGK